MVGDLAQIHDLDLPHAAAAEGEQLPGEIGGPLRRGHDLLDAFLEVVGIGRHVQEKRGLHLDHREEIVEVMRDAARELTDGLHLLGLPELILKLAAHRDVGGHAGVAAHRAIRVADGKRAVLNPAHRAVGPEDAVFHVVGLAGLQAVPLGLDARRVLGVDCFQPRLRVGVETFAGAAPNFFVGRADVDDPLVGEVGKPEDLVDVVGDLAEALFALVQRGLGLLAKGDVADQREVVSNSVILEIVGGDLDRNNRALPGLVDGLEGERAGGLEFLPVADPARRGEIGVDVGDAEGEQFFAAVAEAPAGFVVHIEEPGMFVDEVGRLAHAVEGEVHERQLAFGGLALGDVPPDVQHADDLIERVGLGNQPDIEEAVAGGQRQADLEFDGGLGGERPFDRLADREDLRRTCEGPALHRNLIDMFAVSRGGRGARDPFEGVVCVEITGVPVEAGDDVGGVFREGAELAFGFLQTADVAGDAEHADDAARGVPLGCQPDEVPGGCALSADHRDHVLELHGAGGCEHISESALKVLNARVVRINLHRRPADQLVRRKLKQFLAGRIDVGKTTLPIIAGDRIGGVFHQGAKPVHLLRGRCVGHRPVRFGPGGLA